MKKTFLVSLVLFIATVAFAFEPGTKNIGGQVAFSSYMHSKKNSGVSYYCINPIFGYAFLEDFTADVELNIQGAHEKNYKESRFGLGLGARFYRPFMDGQLYGGSGLVYDFSKCSLRKYNQHYSDYINSNHTHSYGFLKLKGGYLMPLSESIFLDMSANYHLNFVSGDGQLGFMVGLQMFLEPGPFHLNY